MFPARSHTTVDGFRCGSSQGRVQWFHAPSIAGCWCSKEKRAHDMLNEYICCKLYDLYSWYYKRAVFFEDTILYMSFLNAWSQCHNVMFLRWSTIWSEPKPIWTGNGWSCFHDYICTTLGNLKHPMSMTSYLKCWQTFRPEMNKVTNGWVLTSSWKWQSASSLKWFVDVLVCFKTTR